MSVTVQGEREKRRRGSTVARMKCVRGDSTKGAGYSWTTGIYGSILQGLSLAGHAALQFARTSSHRLSAPRPSILSNLVLARLAAVRFSIQAAVPSCSQGSEPSLRTHNYEPSRPSTPVRSFLSTDIALTRHETEPLGLRLDSEIVLH